MTRENVSWDPGRLEEKFREDLGRLVGKGSKVVAAVSGGPDSMVLLHLLLKVKEGLDLDLVAAHLDHGLRGAEGDRDRKAVHGSGRILGCAFYLGSDRLPKTQAGQLHFHRRSGPGSPL